MRIIYNTIPVLLPLVLITVSCNKPDSEDGLARNVCIVYSAGYNNLSADLTEDLEDMATKGYVPKKNGRDILLVISQRTAKKYDYETPTAPYLYRIYKQSGKIIKDTLYSLGVGSSVLESQSMQTLLGKARDLFPAESYGMVFSSHGSGWLPAGFYSNPSQFRDASALHRPRKFIVPDIYLQDPIPGGIRTKAFGAEFYVEPEGKDTFSKEMDIEDMAAAIPMHLDYLLFDACLMGGVEVAWALREVTDYIGFSQAEVLSEGFDYTTLAEYLLQGSPDPVSVCKKFFEYYERQTGMPRSCTVSLVRTDALEALAQACKPLFETFRTTISELKASEVQGFGGIKRYFYDMADILEKAGVPEGTMSHVHAALDRCIVYKNHTSHYYSDPSKDTYAINAFCGLSMYLPSPYAVSTGKAYLDQYYRGLGWNKAAGLVK